MVGRFAFNFSDSNIYIHTVNMADGETLKLPKPVSGNDIRTDFLTFPGDRRWDLLGFVKSDEIEEIKSCDVGHVCIVHILILYKIIQNPYY